MEALGELMDPDALREFQEKIAEKVANKEEITVPLHFLYWSDGREDKVPGPKAQMTQQDPADLPRNYTVWKQNPPRTDLYLYGHPRGRFPSTDQFTYHVWSLLNNKVSECDCRLCEGNVRGQGESKGKDKT
ncbi:hypothetical protein E4T49_04179 [Aureobasidium sp. EXF-10728]|nr:hypothetical protein E4T49_04179 [Aureobasidium sp. EXF-10728]